MLKFIKYLILFFKSFIITFIISILIFLLLQFFSERTIEIIQIFFQSLKLSLVLLFILIIVQLIFVKRYTGSFDYPEKQEAVISTNKANNIKELANLIAKKFNWKIKTKDEKQLICTSSMQGIFSFGERIQINIIEQVNSESKLKVISVPLFKLTVFDFAKNHRNIDQIKTSLK